MTNFCSDVVRLEKFCKERGIPFVKKDTGDLDGTSKELVRKARQILAQG